MITVRTLAGKLLAIRITMPVTAFELADLKIQVMMTLNRQKGSAALIADFRAASAFPPDLADTLGAFLKQDIPQIERSAYFVPSEGGAMLTLQVERALREAQSPRRRQFRRRTELQLWLGEVLSGPERAALTAFLDAGEESSRGA
jgi:hypothetical protein